MKLVHASIPADNPQVVAEVLARVMDGEALRFPPGGPEAWMAWSGDGEVDLEVVQRGRLIEYGPDEGSWRMTSLEPQRTSEVHLAISVSRSADEVLAIAQEAGWPARRCARGNGLFELVEVWVEGCFMIEFLDPMQTDQYAKVVTLANWKAMLGRQPIPA